MTVKMFGIFTSGSILLLCENTYKTECSRNVEKSDEGQYMCQINTAEAKTRIGNLYVMGM